MNSRLRGVFVVLYSGMLAVIALCIALVATGMAKGRDEDRCAEIAGGCVAGLFLTFAVQAFVIEYLRFEFRRYLLRVMAITTKKGLSLGHAFLALADDFDGSRRKVVYRILGLLDEGKPLSDALAVGAPKVVPPHVIEAIRAAEKSGNLAPTLEAAAEESQEARSYKGTVVRSLLYPAAILYMGVFLATFIVPQYGAIFSQVTDLHGNHLEMPRSTLFFLFFSNMLVNYGFPVALGILVLGVPFLVPSPRRWFRWVFDPLSFRIPVLGRIRRLRAGERVCRSLAGFVRAGTPLEAALPQAAAASGSLSVRRSADRAVESLQAGKPADQALQLLLLPRFVLARAGACTGGTQERLAASLEALATECRWRHLRLADMAVSSIYPATVAFGGAFVFLTWLSVFGAVSKLQGALIPW
jgi:general secretion pathway protein F